MADPTPAERLFVEAYLATGTMKGAAAYLGMREGTVRTRMSRMYRRHRVRNITELVLRVQRVDPDAPQ